MAAAVPNGGCRASPFPVCPRWPPGAAAYFSTASRTHLRRARPDGHIRLREQAPATERVSRAAGMTRRRRPGSPGSRRCWTAAPAPRRSRCPHRNVSDTAQRELVSAVSNAPGAPIAGQRSPGSRTGTPRIVRVAPLQRCFAAPSEALLPPFRCFPCIRPGRMTSRSYWMRPRSRRPTCGSPRLRPTLGGPLNLVGVVARPGGARTPAAHRRSGQRPQRRTLNWRNSRPVVLGDEPYDTPPRDFGH